MMHRQRGAIGLFGALVLGLAVSFVALALDAGRLALEKRRLQHIADAAAIAAAQQLGTCVSSIPTFAEVATAAQQAAVANGYQGDLVREAGAVTVGQTLATQGVRTGFQATDLTVAEAVQVRASKSVPASLVLGGPFRGNIPFTAQAAARRYAEAVFTLGTGLFEFDTSAASLPLINALFSGLLDGGVNLSLANYEGLASARVKLRELVDAAATIAGTEPTMDSLLETNLSVGQFLDVVASAVGADSAAVAGIGVLSQQATGAADPIPSFTLGQMFTLNGPSSDSLLDSQLSVLDILTGGLLLGREGTAISLPLNFNLALGTLGEASVAANLRAIRPPKLAAGRPGFQLPTDDFDEGAPYTQASTSAIALTALTSLDLNVLSLTEVKLDLPVTLHLAPSTAVLSTIDCSGVANPAHRVTLEVMPGIVQLGLGSPGPTGGLSGAPVQASVSLLGTPIADIRISSADILSISNNPGTELDMPVASGAPFPLSDTVGTAPGGALAGALSSLAQNLNVEVSLLGGSLNLGILTSLLQSALQAAVQGAIGPVLASLDDAVLMPLLDGLGIKVGSATVKLLNVYSKDFRPPAADPDAGPPSPIIPVVLVQ